MQRRPVSPFFQMNYPPASHTDTDASHGLPAGQSPSFHPLALTVRQQYSGMIPTIPAQQLYPRKASGTVAQQHYPGIISTSAAEQQYTGAMTMPISWQPYPGTTPPPPPGAVFGIHPSPSLLAQEPHLPEDIQKHLATLSTLNTNTIGIVRRDQDGSYTEDFCHRFKDIQEAWRDFRRSLCGKDERQKKTAVERLVKTGIIDLLCDVIVEGLESDNRSARDNDTTDSPLHIAVDILRDTFCSPSDYREVWCRVCDDVRLLPVLVNKLRDWYRPDMDNTLTKSQGALLWRCLGIIMNIAESDDKGRERLRQLGTTDVMLLYLASGDDTNEEYAARILAHIVTEEETSRLPTDFVNSVCDAARRWKGLGEELLENDVIGRALIQNGIVDILMDRVRQTDKKRDKVGYLNFLYDMVTEKREHLAESTAQDLLRLACSVHGASPPIEHYLFYEGDLDNAVEIIFTLFPGLKEGSRFKFYQLIIRSCEFDQRGAEASETGGKRKGNVSSSREANHSPPHSRSTSPVSPLCLLPASKDLLKLLDDAEATKDYVRLLKKLVSNHGHLPERTKKDILCSACLTFGTERAFDFDSEFYWDDADGVARDIIRELSPGLQDEPRFKVYEMILSKGGFEQQESEDADSEKIKKRKESSDSSMDESNSPPHSRSTCPVSSLFLLPASKDLLKLLDDADATNDYLSLLLKLVSKRPEDLPGSTKQDILRSARAAYCSKLVAIDLHFVKCVVGDVDNDDSDDDDADDDDADDDDTIRTARSVMTAMKITKELSPDLRNQFRFNVFGSELTADDVIGRALVERGVVSGLMERARHTDNWRKQYNALLLLAMLCETHQHIMPPSVKQELLDLAVAVYRGHIRTWWRDESCRENAKSILAALRDDLERAPTHRQLCLELGYSPVDSPGGGTGDSGRKRKSTGSLDATQVVAASISSHTELQADSSTISEPPTKRTATPLTDRQELSSTSIWHPPTSPSALSLTHYASSSSLPSSLPPQGSSLHNCLSECHRVPIQSAPNPPSFPPVFSQLSSSQHTASQVPQPSCLPSTVPVSTVSVSGHRQHLGSTATAVGTSLDLSSLQPVHPSQLSGPLPVDQHPSSSFTQPLTSAPVPFSPALFPALPFPQQTSAPAQFLPAPSSAPPFPQQFPPSQMSMSQPQLQSSTQFDPSYFPSTSRDPAPLVDGPQPASFLSLLQSSSSPQHASSQSSSSPLFPPPVDLASDPLPTQSTLAPLQPASLSQWRSSPGSSGQPAPVSSRQYVQVLDSPTTQYQDPPTVPSPDSPSSVGYLLPAPPVPYEDPPAADSTNRSSPDMEQFQVQSAVISHDSDGSSTDTKSTLHRPCQQQITSLQAERRRDKDRIRRLEDELRRYKERSTEVEEEHRRNQEKTRELEEEHRRYREKNRELEEEYRRYKERNRDWETQMESAGTEHLKNPDTQDIEGSCVEEDGHLPKAGVYTQSAANTYGMTQLTSGRDVYLYQSDLQLAMNNSTPSDVTSNRPCDGTRLARRLLHIFFSLKERKAGSIAVDPKPGLVRLNPTVTEAIIVRCLELDTKTTRGKVRDAMASSLSAERAGSRRKHTAKKRTTKSCNTDQCEQGSSRDCLQEVSQTTGMRKRNEEEFAPLPDTHVTVAGFTLTPGDLRTLMPGDDIVDEVINAYLNVLRLEGSATSYYVFPTQVPLQWGTSGVPLFHGLDVSRYTWLFQPMLVNGKHWVLLAANVADRTVSLLDSLNPLGRPDEEQILNRFRQYMKTREKKMRIPDSMTWTTKRITCSQQKDGHSCGVFVMMNAEALVEGRTPSTFQQDDVPAARVKVYNRLIGYSHPLT